MSELTRFTSEIDSVTGSLNRLLRHCVKFKFVIAADLIREDIIKYQKLKRILESEEEKLR